MTKVTGILREQVRQRARDCCEYCQMPQECDELAFEAEHVLPQKHGGPTVLENLAWACFPCNRFKGPNLSGIDPTSRQIVELFQPRRDSWGAHFHWNGPLLVGLTAIGKATIVVLRINDDDRTAIRRVLIVGDKFPPARVAAPNS